ncbi:PTS sorbitol transporter subunit IIA [Latilactobacillus curvatus]|uniref:PTS glucitol/sorbitol transporter subunit IIA n=1 Tax=Latilactobacillus curvatus TaxID=28038 RepID=UPI0009766ADA|nr:PTS glucitol/sorbitol transporter subunit IIA [Latilactobacillus curvatus]MCT1215559.1 PTS sorbitol transporter subunit IIA [Latilactobacillus curvatus]
MMTKERTVYSTSVVEIGAESEYFKSINMAILFGDEAPDALRPSCFIVKVAPIAEHINAGTILKIDDREYTITAVGKEVQTNLGNLGHTAINFTGATEAKLAGSLYVSEGEYPDFKVGSKIQILAK